MGAFTVPFSFIIPEQTAKYVLLSANFTAFAVYRSLAIKTIPEVSLSSLLIARKVTPYLCSVHKMPQDWQVCRFGAVLQGEQALNTACLQ